MGRERRGVKSKQERWTKPSREKLGLDLMPLALQAFVPSLEKKKLFIVYISHSLGTILQNSAKLLITPQRDSIPENTANRGTEQLRGD